MLRSRIRSNFADIKISERIFAGSVYTIRVLTNGSNFALHGKNLEKLAGTTRKIGEKLAKVEKKLFKIVRLGKIC